MTNDHGEVLAAHVTLDESPAYRALALYLAGDNEPAWRWAAALVAADVGFLSGSLLLGHLLAEAGRAAMARRAFAYCFQVSSDKGALPLALAAADGLRLLGDDISPLFDTLAVSFCQGSPRLQREVPPPLPPAVAVTPLADSLTGAALITQAETILAHAEAAWAQAKDQSPTPSALPYLPLFSRLDASGLRKMLEVLDVRIAPAGTEIIKQGEEGSEAYLVARGELEVVRENGSEKLPLARLTSGDWFGEMALLARAPRAASVVAATPVIVLVARRDNLDRVAAQEPELGHALTAYCRRRMVQNLARISPILQSFPAEERLALVERFEVRTFEEGERLIVHGKEPAGLFLIASGGVAVSHVEGGSERLILAELGVGDVVGEVALMFRRNVAVADVIAVHPTVTLLLPKAGFYRFIKTRPLLLAELYDLAVRRDEETSTLGEQDVVSTEASDYALL